jgi:hypothetical protein
LRLAAAFVVLLAPWPGLSAFSSEKVAQAGNAFASMVAAVAGISPEIHFVAGEYPEHPWWVRLAVQNVFTTASFEVPVDTRTVVYIRLAVFVAMLVAWPIAATRRGAKAVALGLALLAGTIGISLLAPILQALGLVKVLALGRLTQSALSVGILTLDTYPSMAFAIPGLVGWLTLLLARTSSIAAPAEAFRRRSTVKRTGRGANYS